MGRAKIKDAADRGAGGGQSPPAAGYNSAGVAPPPRDGAPRRVPGRGRHRCKQGRRCQAASAAVGARASARARAAASAAAVRAAQERGSNAAAIAGGPLRQTVVAAGVEGRREARPRPSTGPSCRARQPRPTARPIPPPPAGVEARQGWRGTRSREGAAAGVEPAGEHRAAAGARQQRPTR